MVELATLYIRELKQRRRRGLMSQNNTMHVRFTFWYISLPSSAKQQREMTKFYVSSRTWAHDGKFFFRFLCFNIVHSNLGPGQLASIQFTLNKLELPRKSYKNEKLYFEMTFSLPSSSSLRKVPNKVKWPHFRTRTWAHDGKFFFRIFHVKQIGYILKWPSRCLRRRRCLKSLLQPCSANQPGDTMLAQDTQQEHEPLTIHVPCRVQ